MPLVVLVPAAAALACVALAGTVATPVAALVWLDPARGGTAPGGDDRDPAESDWSPPKW